MMSIDVARRAAEAVHGIGRQPKCPNARLAFGVRRGEGKATLESDFPLIYSITWSHNIPFKDVAPDGT